MSRSIPLLAVLAITACGDDGNTDEGADDAAETSNAGTGNDDGVDDDGDDDGIDEDGVPATIGGADSSSTGPGASTSSSDSTTGSANVNPICVDFCTDYFAVCETSKGNDYADQADCEQACTTFDEKEFACKQSHLSMTDGPESPHCWHANIDGGGAC